VNRRFQSGASAIQEPVRSEHGIPESPYLRADECARYLRFDTTKQFYDWLETGDGRALPKLRRGTRTLLFDRRVVDAFVRGELSANQRVAKRLSVVHTDQPTEAQK
jgi:hypothetical protein